MSIYSEDDWSVVSEDEEILSDTSFDEVEREPEVQVESDSEVVVIKAETSAVSSTEVNLSTSEEDTTGILPLLADTDGSKRSTAGYSREIRVSLLSPAHQDRYGGAPPRYTPPSSAFKRSIKLAFTGAEVRPKSFPDRLRAITAALRPDLIEVLPPTFTEVTPFKQDQCTQVDLGSSAATSHDHRAVLLRDALDRSMTTANQLRSKIQDNERLSLRIAELESVAAQTERKSRRMSVKLRMTERSLALAKQQAKLSADYQDNLKTISDRLRQENGQLTAQSAVLRGEEEDLAARSLDELEELETMLACGMENVRAALRVKYRAAVEKRREKDLCVVCYEKPVSVVLMPCRHQVLCAPCAVRVPICPIDRKDIQDKVLTYGLNTYSDSEN